MSFVLGVILYTAAAKAGLSGDAMKNAVEVATKAQGALPKPDGKP